MKYNAVKSKKLSRYTDKRYVMINVESGEVVDDAGGYGYKSPQAAHRAWSYKNKSAQEKEKTKNQHATIIAWIDHNKSIMSNLEDAYLIALKEDRELTTKDIEEIIGKHQEFTTRQFLYVYQNYPKIKRSLK